MTIKKVKGGYKVYSKTKKKYLSKKPLSKAKAKAQHGAVMANKKGKSCAGVFGKRISLREIDPQALYLIGESLYQDGFSVYG